MGGGRRHRRRGRDRARGRAARETRRGRSPPEPPAPGRPRDLRGTGRVRRGPSMGPAGRRCHTAVPTRAHGTISAAVTANATITATRATPARLPRGPRSGGGYGIPLARTSRNQSRLSTALTTRADDVPDRSSASSAARTSAVPRPAPVCVLRNGDRQDLGRRELPVVVRGDPVAQRLEGLAGAASCWCRGNAMAPSASCRRNSRYKRSVEDEAAMKPTTPPPSSATMRNVPGKRTIRR